MRQAAFILALLLGFMVQSAGAGTIDIHLNGNVQGDYFSGSGAGLTDLPGGNIAGGTITNSTIAARTIESSRIAFYSRVAVVAPTGGGGDYDNPAEAMAAYATWCPSLSASNPCLLKIMPGLYDIGNSTVEMRPYIDIEGSGENVTIIRGTIDSTTNGVVKGADNSELRFLTIQNSGVVTNAIAIYNSYTSPKITNVTVTYTGSIGSTATNIYGVYNNAGGIGNYTSPIMKNMTINLMASYATNNYGVYHKSTDCSFACSNTSSMTNSTISIQTFNGSNAYGVYNDLSSPILSNVIIDVWGGSTNYGVNNATGSSVRVNNSAISGANKALFAAAGAVFAGATKLEHGTGTSGTGAVTCAGVYDANYAFYASTCP